MLSALFGARLHLNKVFVNGRLQRWPPFARGSSSGSWIGFAAPLAYGGHYRALARGATIPGDRLVRPDSEKPYLPRLAAAGRMGAIFGGLLLPLFMPKEAEPVAPPSWIADAPKAPVKPQAVPGQSASTTLPGHPEAPATTTPPRSVS